MLIVAGVVVLAVIVVVVLVIVAGGDDKKNEAQDAPTNASVADFCGTIDLSNMDFDSVDESDFKSVQDKMRKVGTPSGMPADARDGWEVFVSASNADDIKSHESELTAFGQYWVETCGGLGGGGTNP
jgi:hypothetical protein